MTIQKRGLMSINRAAYEAIGKPEGVELLWDPERKLIGFRPAPLTKSERLPRRTQVPNPEKADKARG
ncbi:hypothetical protein ACFOD2_16695 [Clavibacter michiganensis subsp. insidiosus]|uniref:hypothetical protein n=1 Tax=Clavibacter michiganensis TaxID=28447 RepID=UPI00360C4F5C